MNRFRLPVVVAVIALGAWACTAPASGASDAPLAQVSKKKSCKQKGAKRAVALAGAQAAKKRKRKCKASGGAAETPLSVKITSCPTGVLSGSGVATVSGTAAVGPQITTYIYFNQADDYFDTLVGQEVRVYPSASGAWSYSFTPGFPPGWVSTDSWEERVAVFNYRAHDSVYAECSWTVVR